MRNAGGRLHTGATPGMADVNLGADYTDAEREFMIAIEHFQREHHKPYPDCRDVLAVALSLGYRRVAERRELPHRQQ